MNNHYITWAYAVGVVRHNNLTLLYSDQKAVTTPRTRHPAFVRGPKFIMHLEQFTPKKCVFDHCPTYLDQTEYA